MTVCSLFPEFFSNFQIRLCNEKSASTLMSSMALLISLTSSRGGAINDKSSNLGISTQLNLIFSLLFDCKKGILTAARSLDLSGGAESSANKKKLVR